VFGRGPRAPDATAMPRTPCSFHEKWAGSDAVVECGGGLRWLACISASDRLICSPLAGRPHGSSVTTANGLLLCSLCVLELARRHRIHLAGGADFAAWRSDTPRVLAPDRRLGARDFWSPRRRWCRLPWDRLGHRKPGTDRPQSADGSGWLHEPPTRLLTPIKLPMGPVETCSAASTDDDASARILAFLAARSFGCLAPWKVFTVPRRPQMTERRRGLVITLVCSALNRAEGLRAEDHMVAPQHAA